jgi:hypothetical protein
MPGFVIVACLMVMIAGVLYAGYAQTQMKKKGNGTISTRSINLMSDDQIGEQLAKLTPEKKRKKPLSAMCYDMAAPPDRIEYVCPKCGEKTLYSESMNGYTTLNGLEILRKEFSTLTALKTDCTLTLDETSLCAHCTPDTTTHTISLIVKYSDKKIHTATSVDINDVYLLKTYFNHDDSYTSTDGSVHLLKDEIFRLKDLLGANTDLSNVSK